MGQCSILRIRITPYLVPVLVVQMMKVVPVQPVNDGVGGAVCASSANGAGVLVS